MNSNNYYDIIEENNDFCYAGFCHKIKWNVSAIAGCVDADGYIVQRVHYTDTVGASPSVDDYYEAWRVCGGACIGSSDYDDIFLLDVNYSERPILQSLGKQGSICYETKVYWVDNAHPLYSVVDSWKENSTPMAGDLKTVFVNDCKEFDNAVPCFSRRFEHEFDCRSNEAVEMALRQAYAVRINNNDPGLRSYLQEILNDSKYIWVIDKLCPLF